ncbi:MAG: zinc-binding alcohol dehydrogenase family protein [Pirellulales bacterium]
MRAIQFAEPLSINLIDLPEPAPPLPGEAVVRVHRVGICGTDYSGYLGKMPFFSYPRIPGHELGVEVVAVGEGVANVAPGDRCSVEPYINCQKCYSCQRGHTNCCENHLTLGVHCDGGLRPLFTVPARKLHISRKLAFDQLALVETLAIGCHAIERAKPQPGQTLLVIGAGPIGLSVVEFARISGARTVVLDMNEQRLAFVREEMRIADRLLAKGDGQELQKLAELTDGRLADIVVDATGSNKSMSGCLAYATFAGRVVYVGITTSELQFPHAPIMHRRELTLLASRNALSADFSRIISLIENGQIDTRPWISHQAPYTELATALPQWLKPESRVIKAIACVE